jgi:alkanesulfonate monooxygenase SsuD/methylene tetrahydromethanopterin reductase-like flavin-dependent oxidoreductase (luciferase family)
VYALPLYHPIRLIEEICMLDQLSGGRFDMGFGRGSSPVEIEYFGVNSDMTHTQKVYDEALQVVRQGLATQRVDHQGEFYQFKNVPIMLEPVQKPHPPLWYGAHAPDSSERAARQGQNIISLDPPPLARLLFEHYDRAWRESHGAAPLPKVGLGRFIVVAETDEEALRIARRAYLRWHESFVYLFKVHNREMRHPRPTTFDGVLEVGQGVAGSPETVLAALKKQIHGTVCNYIVGQFAFGDLSLAETTRSLDLFVKRVAPVLRTAS